MGCLVYRVSGWRGGERRGCFFLGEGKQPAGNWLCYYTIDVVMISSPTAGTGNNNLDTNKL